MTDLITLNNFLNNAIGFESFFERFRDLRSVNTGFPHYNIRKAGTDKYILEMALAGFSPKDIEVEVEDGRLSIRSVKEDTSEAVGEIYRGIAYRKFERKFTLADSVVVNGAKLENGMLTVDLERVVPEEKKPRLITVK